MKFILIQKHLIIVFNVDRGWFLYYLIKVAEQRVSPVMSKVSFCH